MLKVVGHIVVVEKNLGFWEFMMGRTTCVLELVVVVRQFGKAVGMLCSPKAHVVSKFALVE